jgi:hypothetical protein
MWKRAARGLGLQKGASIKYLFEVQVVMVDGLPNTDYRRCRVVLNRRAKVAMTDEKESRSGNPLAWGHHAWV